jgi:hypothetical protein
MFDNADNVMMPKVSFDSGRLEYRRSALDQFIHHQIRPAHHWLSRGSIIPSTLGSGK